MLQRPSYWADDFLISALQRATGIQTLVIGRAGRGYGPLNIVTQPYRPVIVVVLGGRHFEPVSVGRVRMWAGVGALDPPALRAMGVAAALPMLASVPMPPARLDVADATVVDARAEQPGMVGVDDGAALLKAGPIDPPRTWRLGLTLGDGRAVDVDVTVDQNRLRYLVLPPEGWRVDGGPDRYTLVDAR